MNSAEKHRIQTAYDRAGLVAALASRGFYVIGEVWRDRICGRPIRPGVQPAIDTPPGDDQPRPAPRDCEPRPSDLMERKAPDWQGGP